MIRFNVWDGWELLEEYGSVRAVAYLQGATGVIKSWGNNGTIYYYQDKLGSTTHIANASGALVESYRYDLYGTPTYYVPGDPNARSSSSHGIVDLYAGEHWIPELGLYDLRNRFMSPEPGRFLQADPIGFKGDPSNLYRYCGNNAINRVDPMGLADILPPPGMDDLGVQATMNSTAASSKEGEGGRGQAIVVPISGGRARLATNAKGQPLVSPPAEELRVNRMVNGRLKEYVYHIERIRVPTGFRAVGFGHHHKDKTAREGKDFSEIDMARAREGLWAYKSNESSPHRVERLTPQTTGTDLKPRPVSRSEVSNSSSISLHLEIELRGTGVPSLAAESINTVTGPL